MTEISNCMMIAINEIKDDVDHTLPLKEKLFEAMKKSLNHWFVTDNREQFDEHMNFHPSLNRIQII